MLKYQYIYTICIILAVLFLVLFFFTEVPLNPFSIIIIDTGLDPYSLDILQLPLGGDSDNNSDTNNKVDF